MFMFDRNRRVIWCRLDTAASLWLRKFKKIHHGDTEHTEVAQRFSALEPLALEPLADNFRLAALVCIYFEV
jgi:hypothetical protein